MLKDTGSTRSNTSDFSKDIAEMWWLDNGGTLASQLRLPAPDGCGHYMLLDVHAGPPPSGSASEGAAGPNRKRSGEEIGRELKRARTGSMHFQCLVCNSVNRISENNNSNLAEIRSHCVRAVHQRGMQAARLGYIIGVRHSLESLRETGTHTTVETAQPKPVSLVTVRAIPIPSWLDHNIRSCAWPHYILSCAGNSCRSNYDRVPAHSRRHAVGGLEDVASI